MVIDASIDNACGDASLGIQYENSLASMIHQHHQLPDHGFDSNENDWSDVNSKEGGKRDSYDLHGSGSPNR